MLIAFLDIAIDGGGVDSDGYFRFGDVFVVDINGTIQFFKASPDIRHHQMPNLKADIGVIRVDVPGCCECESGKGQGYNGAE